MGDGENGSWVLGAGSWFLVSGFWILDTRYRFLDVGFQTVVTGSWILFWDDAVLLTFAFLKNFLAAVISKIGVLR
jgi:hypothetical protein